MVSGGLQGVAIRTRFLLAMCGLLMASLGIVIFANQHLNNKLAEERGTESELPTEVQRISFQILSELSVPIEVPPGLVPRAF